MKLDDVIQQPGHQEWMQQSSILKNAHTSVIGKVVRFNKSKRCVDIQPLIREVGDSKLPPLLLDVPVWFPGGYTYNVNVGDECLVVISDRSIDMWWQNGDVSSPISARNHDLSDGIAFIGIRSLPNANEWKCLEDEFARIEEEATSMLGMKLYIKGSDGCLYFEKATGSAYIDEDGRVIYEALPSEDISFSLNSDGELIMEVA